MIHVGLKQKSSSKSASKPASKPASKQGSSERASKQSNAQTQAKRRQTIQGTPNPKEMPRKKARPTQPPPYPLPPSSAPPASPGSFSHTNSRRRHPYAVLFAILRHQSAPAPLFNNDDLHVNIPPTRAVHSNTTVNTLILPDCRYTIGH